MSSENGAIVIAGATRGLGRELALIASKSNYPVAIMARNGAQLSELQYILLENNQLNVSAHEVDLTDKNSTQKAFEEIKNSHKKITALINCAATWTGGKTVTQLSFDDMQQSIMLNFFTAFNSIKSMLNLPEDAICKPAAIINVGATASLRGAKNCAAFAVAKGALRQLSQSLARELWSHDIHVAHLIIDGLIGNKRTKMLNENMTADRFIDMTSIAHSILQVIQQEKSCWTFEWDIRPFNEPW